MHCLGNKSKIVSWRCLCPHVFCLWRSILTLFTSTILTSSYTVEPTFPTGTKIGAAGISWWCLTHAVHILQKFFRGRFHVSHYRHQAAILHPLPHSHSSIWDTFILFHIITWRCILRLWWYAVCSISGRCSGHIVEEVVAASSLWQACRDLVNESSGFPPYILMKIRSPVSPTTSWVAFSCASTAHHCCTPCEFWISLRILHFPWPKNSRGCIAVTPCVKY